MERRQWVNRSQPQTLQAAVILLYLNAVLALIGGGIFGGGLFALLSLVAIVALVAGGLGVASERKWGYVVALVVSVLYVLGALYGLALGAIGFSAIINLAFDVALLALLLHPMSREYRRVWFR
ncbi:MAG: hypothetical protein ACRDYD_05790 [Acidimicrobiales bacterium]